MHRHEVETAPLNPFTTAQLYLGQYLPSESLESSPPNLPTEGSVVPAPKHRPSRDDDLHRVHTEGDTTRISIPIAESPRHYSLFQVISPDRRLREAWDVVYDLLIIYSLCTSAYYLAFQRPSNGLYAFDVCVWVFFVIDVWLTFNTAYVDEDNHMVGDRKGIARHYITTWFWIDVVALLPFSFGDLEEVEYYLRLVRLLRLPYSVDFVDGTGLGSLFSAAFRALPDIEVGNFMISYYHISLLFQQISRMILLSYFLAALYYWYAKHTGPEHIYSTAWFEDSARLTDAGGDVRFLRSWYYMLTTLLTIGYGDFLPTTFCERILMIPILFIGITNFSFILSTFVSLINQINEINSSSDLPAQASNWMESIESAGHQISPALKAKVLTYFANYGQKDRLGPLAAAWWQANSVEELTTSGDEFFTGLPEETGREIIAFLFSDLFTKYRAFFGLPKCKFAYEIALHFQPWAFSHAEILLKEGGEATEILLLARGKVACEFQMRQESHQILYFETMVTIGDYQVLTNTASKFTFRAVGRDLQMFAIPARPFLDILDGKYAISHKKALFQRTAQFNSMLIKAKDDYMAKKDPGLLASRRTMRSTTSILLQRFIKRPTIDTYTLTVNIHIEKQAN